MRIAKTKVVMILAALLITMGLCLAEDDVFIRIDRDDPNAWKAKLANVRLLQDEAMSGSAQFSQTQFCDLAAKLREQAGEVWVVDCRLESHGFINGIAVSWCNAHNDANRGKTAEEVEAEEAALTDLVGTTVAACTTQNDRPKDIVEFYVEKWETERHLVEAEGLHYLRLACLDHCWPDSDVIDAFIDFTKSLNDDVWLHFHCQAGSGRTGALMTVYEMMQKPGVPVEEILQHQMETGSGNLLERSAPQKSHVQKERCVLVRAMYQYINENRDSGYDVKWSAWLKKHSHELILRVGECLNGEGFSSDPLVVSDSLAAMAYGQATVLVGEDVYFITVTDK